MASDNRDTVLIKQGEFGFTHFRDAHPRIMTVNLNYCVAVCGYDPESQVAFMSHFDFPVTMRNLKNQLQTVCEFVQFNGVGTGKRVSSFQCRVVGGKPVAIAQSKRMRRNAFQILRDLNNEWGTKTGHWNWFSFDEAADPLRKVGDKPLHFGVDCRTGEYFNADPQSVSRTSWNLQSKLVYRPEFFPSKGRVAVG
ncbi:hypothetical protein MARSALSMR5_04095 (plasmid) [Marinobacter salarius]|uniref:Uncharacterized protein n=2 Tax=Marinobacter salarius TaxID=1420917 RepID=A0A1W6KF91_9GAMM|nr:hypothetical protein MARSALSMR5_04095 [Marinobacter salarius]